MSIVWDFIQNQLLGMKWLNKLIGMGLSALGLDITGRIGGSIQFFLYDVIKITVLLCFLILFISYIQSYFPPERSKKIFRTVSWDMGEYHRCIARNGHALLLLFFYSIIYRLYQRRTSSRCDLFLLDLLPDG